ncbi:unnamed protein product [Paramecium pentaurelia]|uniref:Uncharacterized protein n=1 Tax=Paramecium pentaurelia TaxID=43138 RepID=A0A8S1XEA4_9CILI|nr:unnamed protein product [Paramecium pentaurelia]
MYKQPQQPTPRNVVKQTPLNTQEILQRLMKKNSKSKIQLIDIADDTKIVKNEKFVSKSPCSGWQSFRNQSSEKAIHKIRHQSNEDLQKTLKKPCHLNHVSSMIGFQQKDVIQNANAFLREKNLENKLDTLTQQISKLREKSEQLELQNKLLFDNLQKYKCEGNQERNALLERLDHMIEMQQKQEENLQHIKTLFSDNSRRIKTQQSQPKQRSFGKSAYMGFNI